MSASRTLHVLPATPACASFCSWGLLHFCLALLGPRQGPAPTGVSVVAHGVSVVAAWRQRCGDGVGVVAGWGTAPETVFAV